MSLANPPLGELMLAELVTLEIAPPAAVELSVSPASPVTLVVTPTASLTVIEGVQGAKGDKGDKGDNGDESTTYVAGGTVSGEKALMFSNLGTVVHADPTADSYIYVGVSLSAALAGGDVAVKKFGNIVAPFWSWTPELPVFVAPGGNLTQVPPSTGRSHLIGWAIDAHTIHLFPDPVVPIQ